MIKTSRMQHSSLSGWGGEPTCSSLSKSVALLFACHSPDPLRHPPERPWPSLAVSYFYFILFFYFMVSQYKNKISEVDSEKDVVIETLWYCTVGILKP